MKSINQHKTRFKKKFLIIFASVLIFSLAILPNVFAQDYTDIFVTLEVAQGQIAELTLDGCWQETMPGDDDWDFRGTAISLLQPGDREIGTGGDPYTWYDVFGGDPNGNATMINKNAFAYGDCRFEVTVQNHSTYEIQFYGTDFNRNPGPWEIPDMIGSTTTGFDFILDSEDPKTGTGDEYPAVAGQGEHGFFIVYTEIDSVVIQEDKGYGTIIYDFPKKFTDAICGAGSARPCYHMIPEEANAKILVDDSAGDLTGKKIVIRKGLGATGIAAGDYAMTSTMRLYTAP